MIVSKINEVLNETIDLLTEGVTMDSKWFSEQVENYVKKLGKQVNCSYHNKFSQTNDMVIVSFYNISTGENSGGAFGMNNRVIFNVDGFNQQLGENPPSGKVKLSLQSGYLFQRFGLKKPRARTGTPSKILDYLKSILKLLSEQETIGK